MAKTGPTLKNITRNIIKIKTSLTKISFADLSVTRTTGASIKVNSATLAVEERISPTLINCRPSIISFSLDTKGQWISIEESGDNRMPKESLAHFQSFDQKRFDPSCYRRANISTCLHVIFRQNYGLASRVKMCLNCRHSCALRVQSFSNVVDIYATRSKHSGEYYQLTEND
jgi:transcription elongation factor Elf1